MQSIRHGRRRLTGAVAFCLCALLAWNPADAGICFTSGKVYVQQKVYDKACQMLECARQQEPENVQVYSLLAFARAQRRQFVSAGGAFEIGIKMAQGKKDEKRIEELEQNRRAVTAQLFNLGLAALTRAGTVKPSDTRTADAGTPQAAVEKERGAPKDYARFSEGGKMQEFWYYPALGIQYYFPPGLSEPIESPYRPFTGPPDPQPAVVDTTIYPLYPGGSNMGEAGYDFELACYVEPVSADIYKNLSYVFEVLGRTDDAIRAAQMGLKLKPGDAQLTQNLRVAAMGRGNRLFTSGQYLAAVPAYRTAMTFDSAGTLTYLSQIATAYQLAAAPMPKGSPERAAAYDSACATYFRVYEISAGDTTSLRENAIYNASVIQVNLDNNKKAVEYIDLGLKSYPNSEDLLLLAGQTKFYVGDYEGSVAAMTRVEELDPKDATAHEFLFKAYNKLNNKEKSVSEYTLYKALSEGRQRTGAALKTWVNSADNRLGPENQCKATLKADGDPDEVRTYADGDKTLETWFYWSKGIAITFLDGQLFSKATFPAAKS